QTCALPICLQMARMRTIETARPMLRASNTGLAAAIDHRGRVTALSPMFTEHVMTAAVQPRTGDTPYLALGGVPVWMVIVLALGAGLVVARRHDDGDDASGSFTASVPAASIACRLTSYSGFVLRRAILSGVVYSATIACRQAPTPWLRFAAEPRYGTVGAG